MKTRIKLGLISLVLVSLLLGVYIGYSATPSDPIWLSGGVYPKGTYTVFSDGGNYFAKNDQGRIVYSGSVASTVIENAWGNMPNGGELVLKGNIALSSNGIHLNISKYTKGLILRGEGATRTRISYSGLGYALIINTTDASVGYYEVRLESFLINCTSIGVGRHGVLIDQVGRNVVLDDLTIYNADHGVSFTPSVNEVYLYNVRTVTCNIGFYKPNSPTNEISFINCEAIDSKQYGFYLWGGSSLRIFGGVANSENIGVFLHSTWATSITGMYFHHDSTAYTADLVLNGTSAPIGLEGISIEGCYFNGGNYSNHAIVLRHVDNVKIDSCFSRWHNRSFIKLEDVNNELLIINPNLYAGEILLDGGLTQTSSRLAGMVITPNATGLIVHTGNENLTEGDIVSWKTVGSGTVYSTTTLNATLPGVIMFRTRSWATPSVVAISGIVKINNSTVIALGDTLITSTTTKKATVSNTTTDPKRIIGYCIGLDSEVHALVG